MGEDFIRTAFSKGLSSLRTVGVHALRNVAVPLLTACSAGGPVDVLVITVDTLRADHLGAYGSSTSTPRLDALARESTVFERTTAPMPP